jgi:hypothetical protein
LKIEECDKRNKKEKAKMKNKIRSRIFSGMGSVAVRKSLFDLMTSQSTRQ